MARHPDRHLATTYDRELEVVVDPVRARFSTWYELFPRSTAQEPGRHGTFRDVERRLEYVSKLGFDVLYLPPIHPIGYTNRKGRNNSTTAGQADPGSPWAEMKSVVEFWIGHGVRIFRVDNPHTKPFRFWEWLIDEVKGEHPEVVFLSEAFTRPKVMYRLAKIGFTQSYTYFAWRNTKHE